VEIYKKIVEIGGTCNMHHWLRGDRRPCVQQREGSNSQLNNRSVNRTREPNAFQADNMTVYR